MRKILAYTSWWLIMGGFFALTAWLAGGEMPSPGLVFAMTVVNTFFIVFAEQLLPRVEGVSLFRDRQTINDIAHGVLFSFAGRPLASGAGLALFTWVAPRVGTLELYWPRQWPLVAQVALGLLLWGFLNYWLHRAFHSFDRLWGFHAIHHDTPQMHLFKSGRTHVVEEMMQYFFVPLPFLFLGVPAEALVWMGLFLISQGNLEHCNLDQRFHWSCHYVLPTPQLHWIHHAQPRSLHDSNYGATGPIWDLVFGTYKHPDRYPIEAMGLADSPVPAGFLGQLAHPFRELVARREPTPR